MDCKSLSNPSYEKDFMKKYSKIEHRNWINSSFYVTFIPRYKVTSVLSNNLGIAT